MNYIFLENHLAKGIISFIEDKLKRKIIRVKLAEEKISAAVYTLISDKGYLALAISQSSDDLQKIQNAYKKMQENGIPTAKMHQFAVKDKDLDLYIGLAELNGEPLSAKEMHIFAYDRVLKNFAEILQKMHQIKLQKFGFLDKNLVGFRGNWQFFMAQDIEKELSYLCLRKIISKDTEKEFKKRLQFMPAKIPPHFLHGNLCSAAIYLDSSLQITCLTNCLAPLAGDLSYDFAAFLISEGLDRTRRLVHFYNLLGGSIDINSDEFLKTTLRRVIKLMYWKALGRKEDFTSLYETLRGLNAFYNL